ncbi:molluscan insulin-related peptide 3-like [Mytilus trossulus]|uniref:molluscan insulin-related peptide 3-like n=1 Tax=Mytilus trossulus TaxID=6551 RepID=UPI0030052D3E
MRIGDPWSYVILVLLSTQLLVPFVVTDRICNSQSTPHPFGVCGSELSNIMQLICGDRGFNSRMSKRGEVIEDTTDSPLHGIILGKRKAMAYITKRRTHIVCECCHNSCEFSEMEQYCN